MVQLNLNLTEHICAWAQHDTFFILHACKHTCAYKIVCTKCVHDSLQTHMCMSEIHVPNLDYVHANCKPRTVE